MAQDEEATLRRLHEYRKVFNDTVSRHVGTVFGVAGDSEMAVFDGAADAVRCGLELQEAVGRRNAVLPKASRMPIRVGVNFGLVIPEDNDIYGDEVNVAARLESFAEAGEVCISGTVFDLVRGKLECGFDSFGKQRFKNIDRPVRVYRVRTDPQAVGQVIPAKRRRPQPGRYWRFAAVVAFIALIGASVWGVRVQIEMQQSTAAAEKLIQETQESVGEAEDQIGHLLDRLQQVSDREADDGTRIDALIALLQQAQESAEHQQHLSQRRSAEIRRLLELLEASESRASAERARADELLQAILQAEQSTALHRVRERDENLSKSAIEEARNQTLRETLLESWRDAELQASLSQSQAEQLLASVNNLAPFAEVDRATATAMLPDKFGTQVSLKRKRIEALLASLQQAQSVAADKRAEAEDLHARLLESEGTLAGDGTALLTLREWTVKIEELLSTLKTLEARIADDVANAERTLRALKEAERLAGSRILAPARPLPASRLTASRPRLQGRAEQFLASLVRAVHESRPEGRQSPEKVPKSATMMVPVPSVGPDRSGQFSMAARSVRPFMSLSSETPFPPSVAYTPEITSPGAAEGSNKIPEDAARPGPYDGVWILRLVHEGDTQAQFVTEVDISNNTFNIDTVARGWRVALKGAIDETTGTLTASGTIRTLARTIDEIVRIEANLVENAFSAETNTSGWWRPPETLQFTLVPEAAGRIASVTGSGISSTSGAYDGDWILRIQFDSDLEFPVKVSTGFFHIQEISRGWKINFAGQIDDTSGQLIARGQIWTDHWSYRLRRGIRNFNIKSDFIGGSYSGRAPFNSNLGPLPGLVDSLQYTIAPSEETSLKIAALGTARPSDTEKNLSKEVVSGSYDGPWVVRFVMDDYPKSPFEAELDIKDNSFNFVTIANGYSVYLNGKIDEAANQMLATTQVRRLFGSGAGSGSRKVGGIFNIDSIANNGKFFGTAKNRKDARMEIQNVLHYSFSPKHLVQQSSATP